MADLVIRNAQAGDLSALYRLLKAKAVFDGALSALTASESDLGRVLFSDDPKCEFVVADLDGVLVGFAAFYPVFSTYVAKPGLWMDDLFVDEKFRSRGIGLSLLKCLAAKASQRGAANSSGPFRPRTFVESRSTSAKELSSERTTDSRSSMSRGSPSAFEIARDAA